MCCCLPDYVRNVILCCCKPCCVNLPDFRDLAKVDLKHLQLNNLDSRVNRTLEGLQWAVCIGSIQVKSFCSTKPSVRPKELAGFHFWGNTHYDNVSDKLVDNQLEIVLCNALKCFLLYCEHSFFYIYFIDALFLGFYFYTPTSKA